jgi:hypothetical protein
MRRISLLVISYCIHSGVLMSIKRELFEGVSNHNFRLHHLSANLGM